MALAPLALAGIPIREFRLYWFNLIHVGLTPLLYARLILRPIRGPQIRLRQALLLDAALLSRLGALPAGRRWFFGAG